MDAGELLETQLQMLFSDTWQPESTATPGRPRAPAAGVALPARRGITINIPLPFPRGGPPQGEWRARFKRAWRQLAKLAVAARRERRATATTAADTRAELERKARERADRRVAAEIRRERQRLLGHLLAVADNLERALAHAEQDQPLRVGVQLTLRALTCQLAQEQVDPIEALGQPFDPRLHEAVAVDGPERDTVVQVLETGYTLGGELLRPARVVVGGRENIVTQ
jgi:molecular chaperone GrpE